MIQISVVLLLACLSFQLSAQTANNGASATPQDSLVFSNGDHLTGTLERADANSLTFKSAMAGEITVKWENVRELRTAGSFAAFPKNANLTPQTALQVVPRGPVNVTADPPIATSGTAAPAVISIGTSQGPRTTPINTLETLVDAATFVRSVQHEPNLIEGWTGTVSGGFSQVKSTQNSTTYTAGINLLRSVPTPIWLAPRSRTYINYTQSYGTLTQPGTPLVETNVFHANAERDQYLSPRRYYFVGSTFDHNFAQSLLLQQSHGAGLGISVVNSPRQQLEFRSDVHYESQTFSDQTQNQRIIGSTFFETYLAHLPKGIQLTEVGSISPAWNHSNDLSAHANANLILPVYRGIGFNLGVVEDFLNNAPPGSNRNAFQFTTGVSYALKGIK